MSEPDCETFFATLHQTLRVLPQADLDLVKDKPYAGQPYEYSKLESSRSIRLLKISYHGPFSLQEPQFSLVHTTIDIAPTYETLSYVWYTQIRGSTLTLKDGSTLRVTKNLKRALPYIARHCMTGYIWIDQICIAQDDVLEKNHQVSVMRDIYSGCCCVIVWLAELSMSPMPSAELEMAFRNSTALGWGFLPNRAEHFESFRKAMGRIGNCPAQSRELAEELRNIVSSDWIQRAWVFQEAVLPPRSRIVAGLAQTYHDGGSISLWGLRATVEQYFKLMPAAHFTTDYALRRSECDALDTMWNGYAQRNCMATEPKLPLEQILARRTPFAKTSFELDQLYAFFGLNDDPSIDLKISYELSTRDALISTTQSIIRGTLRLDIFECLGHNGHNLPSWVPDFYKRATKNPFLRPITCGEWHSPRAISNLWLGSCDDKVLRAFGRRIDTIKAEIPSPRTSPSITWYLEALSAVTRLDQFAQSLPTMERIIKACLGEGYKLSAVYQHDEITNLANCVLASDEHGMEAHSRLIQALHIAMQGQRLWVTEKGYFATGSGLAKGDITCILHGCTHPVAMYTSSKSGFRVAGTCYLEGWMDPWSNRKVYWDVHDAEEFYIH